MEGCTRYAGALSVNALMAFLKIVINGELPPPRKGYCQSPDGSAAERHVVSITSVRAWVTANNFPSGCTHETCSDFVTGVLAMLPAAAKDLLAREALGWVLQCGPISPAATQLCEALQ